MQILCIVNIEKEQGYKYLEQITFNSC